MQKDRGSGILFTPAKFPCEKERGRGGSGDIQTRSERECGSVSGLVWAWVVRAVWMYCVRLSVRVAN